MELIKAQIKLKEALTHYENNENKFSKISILKDNFTIFLVGILFLSTASLNTVIVALLFDFYYSINIFDNINNFNFALKNSLFFVSVLTVFVAPIYAILKGKKDFFKNISTCFAYSFFYMFTFILGFAFIIGLAFCSIYLFYLESYIKFKLNPYEFVRKNRKMNIFKNKKRKDVEKEYKLNIKNIVNDTSSLIMLKEINSKKDNKIIKEIYQDVEKELSKSLKEDIISIQIKLNTKNEQYQLTNN